MSQITCQTLIDGVQATQLNDSEKIAWSETLLMSALNQALAILTLVRPDATAKVHEFSCVAGTRQNLPADGLRLLKVVRNLTAGGAIGRAVRLVNISDLDSIAPNWHAETPKDTVKEYMFDERSPKWFYVYPPAQASVKLEIEYSAQPTEITDLSQPLPVDMVYMQPLQEFILYKLLSGEGGQGQGMQHYNTGMSLLGAKPAVDRFAAPITETNRATGV